jgi:hypothetical protein
VVVVVTVPAGLPVLPVAVIMPVVVVVPLLVRHGGQPFVRVPPACADAPFDGQFRCRSGKKLRQKERRKIGCAGGHRSPSMHVWTT